MRYELVHRVRAERPDGRVTPRCKGLFTFGSPLDKIDYFFRTRIKPEQKIRAQLLPSLHGFQYAKTGRNFDPCREDEPVADRYDGFPDGFFARTDDSPDPTFYIPPRLVTHLDETAIMLVGDLYEELALTGEILDLCSSWISHFRTAPARLVALGMNAVELEHNAQASQWLIQDLNVDPRLPFPDSSFDGATCCVSVDYLVRPLEVFDEVSRVLRPGGPFVCTFSNRCFPTKAIRGWLSSDDETHLAVVSEYFRRSRGWGDIVAERRSPPGHHADPLYAVWARRAGAGL